MIGHVICRPWQELTLLAKLCGVRNEEDQSDYVLRKFERIHVSVSMVLNGGRGFLFNFKYGTRSNDFEASFLLACEVSQ